jgi:hypothetical protein
MRSIRSADLCAGKASAGCAPKSAGAASALTPGHLPMLPSASCMAWQRVGFMVMSIAQQAAVHVAAPAPALL